MDAHIPLAQPDGPPLPEVPAPQAAPPQAIVPAPEAPGAAHQPLAPPAKRPRLPRGPFAAPSNAGTTSAPALLELAAAYPMSTEQDRVPDTFIPDSQMLFHVMSICDQMMNSTERFTRSSPAWIPLISQLYISVLWDYLILSVAVNCKYGMEHVEIYQEMESILRIEDCMIPGPVVPFFQSLAAVSGPHEWMGDILPTLPSFTNLWNSEGFHPNASYARILPIPAIILDQLYSFSQFAPPANLNTTYATFDWYRSVFTTTNATTPGLNRIGPQLCGSLFTQQAQYDSARNFWNACLTGSFTRINSAEGQPPLTNYRQIFGFESQTGEPQFNWFSSIVITMNKYCQFFNGSVPLKSISLAGIGAVVIYGEPIPNTATRNWLYPPSASLQPFQTNRFLPRREIPQQMRLIYRHADPEVGEQADQYALISYTNIKWTGIETQNNWLVIDDAEVHEGAYWNLRPFRFSSPLNAKNQYHQLVSARYHQQAANRAD